jgi:hypothetical protein
MTQQVRLSLRLHRFELITFGAALLGLSAAAVFFSAQIEAVTPDAACLRNDGSEAPAGCDAALRAWYDVQNLYGAGVLTVLLVLALTVGLFVGVPVVARELERGTARLAWSLAPSRWRWYLVNTIPLLVIVAVLTFIAGVAIDRFVAVTEPYEDVSNSFVGFGVRGGLIASRAILVFAVAVTVGSIVGRALPAVIVAGLVATLVVAGTHLIHQQVMRSEAIPYAPDRVDYARDFYVEQRFRLPDGTLVAWDYFGGSDPYDENGLPIYPEVALAVPGSQYRFTETREAIALAGGTFLTLLAGGVVVSRRRPD